MMLKANGEYLDFNGDIDVESQIRIFETDDPKKIFNGDFSYDIEIQDNGFNRKILGIPRADTIKSIYQVVPSEVIDDTGQSIYTGKLQVNRITGGFISSTFFAGNTEWFAELSQPMSSLPLYRYDVDVTSNNVQDSWLDDDGIVFPILDTGVLVSRSFPDLKIEDFVGCFYVHTLFDEIFNPKGIKVEGDFIDSPLFNKLIVASNGRSQEQVTNRSSYVSKTTAQNGLTAATKVTFQDESTFPYFDGSENNFSSSTYTADVKMRVNVEIVLNIDLNSPPVFATVYFYKNGASFFSYLAGSKLLGGSQTITTSKNIQIPLDAGDTVEIYVDETGGLGGNIDVNSGTIKITPVYIYKVFGVATVPNWTQMEFVSNILRLFNVLPSFNPTSKTLTLDLFNNIKNKPYVDISHEVVINDIDFSEFVSGYAKNNIFTYQESDDEDLREYNISNFVSYGSGNLTIDNAYIENDKTVVESDFTSPITYLNGVFDMSMERFNFTELEEIDDLPIASVTDSSGTPRFDIANADDLFVSGDVVRIETLLNTYNGEWIVTSVTSTYITVNGPTFDATTTGTATLLRHQFTTDDNVYLFVNVQNVNKSFVTSTTTVYFEANPISANIALAYFNLLSNNTNVNRVFKQSLSFGDVNDPLSYQLTLLDTYWPLFSRILNDPVMGFASGYLKKSTFEKIKTFLRPVMIQTEETRNLYYMNRNRSYKGSEVPCSLELIKLN